MIQQITQLAQANLANWSQRSSSDAAEVPAPWFEETYAETYAERRPFRKRVEYQLTTSSSGEVAAADATGAATSVYVCEGDWGEVTLKLTQKYGSPFAVLNMANSICAGGGVVQGMIAQGKLQMVCTRSLCFNTRGEHVQAQRLLG